MAGYLGRIFARRGRPAHVGRDASDPAVAWGNHMHRSRV